MDHKEKIASIVEALLAWYAKNARDLPWRHTRDPYAVWVSEIMLQQTQVNTVIPFWNRWLRELPTVESAAKVNSAKLHKLWEGLGYYTRVRNLQNAAQLMVARHGGRFPEVFDDVLALPGIGRYTAGAICSIAFNQPTPILDGNVIRVLTRIFGIAENPRAGATNARLWELAEQLVSVASHSASPDSCSRLNQSLMELGALVCTPRDAQCLRCPVKQFCVARRERRVEQLPNLPKRAAVTSRRFIAFVVERDGKFLVRQRPPGVVNALLWEFPNVEVTARGTAASAARDLVFDFAEAEPLGTVKHSITRYRITLEACFIRLKANRTKVNGSWKSPAQLRSLALTGAHGKIWRAVQTRTRR